MPEGAKQDLAFRLTYPGTAALAVVRLRGPSAAGFVARHFDRQVPACKCVYGRWRDETGEVLDDVVVVQGREWFDVNLHGGRRIVAKLLEQAAGAGFAVVAGDAAIESAADDEIAAALPRATTETGLRWLLGQPAAWRALKPETVNVEELLADMTLRRLLSPATVAIVGAPNVGKSTLANALFGQERAIVADVPGTTRDWVGGLADLGGVPIVLIDTPGRRQTDDPIEREAITLSERPVEQAEVVITVIDAVCSASPASRGDAAEGAVPHLHVANKCDLAEAPSGWLAISARTGTGLPALIAALHTALGVDVAGAHRRIRANLWNSAQEKLLCEGGVRAVTAIAHRLQNW